jgi:hypothetical protein
VVNALIFVAQGGSEAWQQVTVPWQATVLVATFTPFMTEWIF